MACDECAGGPVPVPVSHKNSESIGWLQESAVLRVENVGPLTNTSEPLVQFVTVAGIVAGSKFI